MKGEQRFVCVCERDSFDYTPPPLAAFSNIHVQKLWKLYIQATQNGYIWTRKAQK